MEPPTGHEGSVSNWQKAIDASHSKHFVLPLNLPLYRSALICSVSGRVAQNSKLNGNSWRHPRGPRLRFNVLSLLFRRVSWSGLITEYCFTDYFRLFLVSCSKPSTGSTIQLNLTTRSVLPHVTTLFSTNIVLVLRPRPRRSPLSPLLILLVIVIVILRPAFNVRLRTDY